MRTAHSSSRPPGGGVCLSPCWDPPPPGVGLETHPLPMCGPGAPPGVGLEIPWPDPPTSPWTDSPNFSQVWAWRTPPGQTPQLPPWVWAWRPPGQTPNFPPGCGPGDPPSHTPQSPLGVGLKTSWTDPQPPPWVWAWRPPQPDPPNPPWVWAWRPPGQTSPLGVGLETPTSPLGVGLETPL